MADADLTSSVDLSAFFTLFIRLHRECHGNWSLLAQESQVPQAMIKAVKEKLHLLITAISAQPAAASVAAFLAESDNITRILKGYGDTLDPRQDGLSHGSMQSAQVSASSPPVHIQSTTSSQCRVLNAIHVFIVL